MCPEECLPRAGSSKLLILIIERLIHRGLGLARVSGKAVFVPAVIPGETVECELVEDRPTYARARLVKLAQASPRRIQPQCPCFPDCGGCQLAHIDYPHQLELKKEILRETLRRIGKFDPAEKLESMIPSLLPFHYRSRLRFHARAGALGFKAFEGNQIINISDCLLARAELSAALPALKDLARELGGERELELDLDPETGKIHAILLGRGKKFYLHEGGKFHKVSPPKKEFLRLMSFAQSNPEQNQKMRALAAEMAEASGAAVGLELFAGAGNLSFELAAKLKKLTAVELNVRAVQLAELLKAGRHADNLQFIVSAAESYLQQAVKAGEKFDLVTLDPPRTGAKKEIELVVKLGPKTVIYISCEPSTLARDLKILLEAGYRLERMVPLDMFPQTYHLETVTLLEKS